LMLEVVAVGCEGVGYVEGFFGYETLEYG